MSRSGSVDRPPPPPRRRSSPSPSRDEFLRRAAERARERLHALQPVPGSEGWLPDTDLWGTAWHDHFERRYACPELLARGRETLARGRETLARGRETVARGREIVARGAVTHLEIRQGGVRARVRAGSEYGVALDIALLSAPRWNALRELCSRRGWLRWEIVGQPPEAFRKAAVAGGLLPCPAEISFRCVCLDRRFPLCEHAAAALYGVGIRLDEVPEALFELRGAHLGAVANSALKGLPEPAPGKTLPLDAQGLADLFGVEVEPEPDPDADLASLEELPAAENRKPPRPPRTLFGRREPPRGLP